MMKIASRYGNRLNAPENSFNAFVSAYTSGASVLEFDVQLTKDNYLVVAHDQTINRPTGTGGDDIFLKDLTLKDLRWGHYDFSETFNPNDIDGFRYYRTARRGQVATFQDTIDQLPDDINYLIGLNIDPAANHDRRELFASLFATALSNRQLQDRVVIYSTDTVLLQMVRALIPTIKSAISLTNIPAENHFQSLGEDQPDVIITDFKSIINDQIELTPLGKTLKESFENGILRLGAIIRPSSALGFTAAEFERLQAFDFIWSVSTDSTLGVYANGHVTEFSQWMYPQYTWLQKSPFNGTAIDRDWFALGYAKANKYCVITHNDGVHIELKDYDGFLPLPRDPNVLNNRLNNLELRMLYVEKTWPFYSGGGVAIVKPIDGDFIAIVDYEMKNPMSQAQTLEMAVTNVDPAGHRGSPPESFRDADAFYDPHGCPPYVGVEHDENDGYRINWNMGSAYDNNQYGGPVGNGAIPRSGTLRLERRGSYFSAYYRNDHEAPFWICVGVVKNESLNQRVYLRCAAKRWLQENEENPDTYYDVQANTFTFRNLHITKPIK